MSISTNLRLFSAAILLVTVLATPQPQSQNGIRFSKLLSEKSDLLKFTSISNTPSEARFHNVYNKAEEVVPARSSVSSHRVVEYPEARVVTRAGPGEEFVRIGQSQVGVEDPDETLTQINHKVSGRTQVTALRQSSGKRLNISPVFPGKDEGSRSSNRRQSVVQEEDNNSEIQSEDSTTSPDFDVDSTAEEEEVTTVQNTELTRETDELSTSTTPVPESVTRNESSSITILTPAPRVTIFDNRTETSTSTASSFNQDPDNENFLDTFHRKGHFPDFEDDPTHLATAESNQPARVNVRPASSGKDYEYEYIYYYYDDDDDDNSTVAKPATGNGAVGVPKADLTGVKPSSGFESDKSSGSKFNADPSNSLDSRGQKSYPEVPIVNTPQPLGNRPIVIKQSNMVQGDGEVEPTVAFPQVPRAGSVPAYVPTTSAAPTTVAVPTRPSVQPTRFVAVPEQPTRFAAPAPEQPSRFAAPVQQPSRFAAPVTEQPSRVASPAPEQPHNRFSPPVKTEFVDQPSVPPQTRFPARSQDQFSRQRVPAPESVEEPVVSSPPQTRFPARNQDQFSRQRAPAPAPESVEEPVVSAPPQTRFPARNQDQFSRQRQPAPAPESVDEPVVSAPPQTRFPSRNSDLFSRQRAPAPAPESVEEPEVSVPQTRFPARPQEPFTRSRNPTPAPKPEVVEEQEQARVQPPRFSAPTRSESLFSRPRVTPTPPPQAEREPEPQIRNKAQSQQAVGNDFAPPIIQIQLVSTEAPVEAATPRRPAYKDVPSGRRINSPRRPAPATPVDPETQDPAPQPVSTTLAPVVVSEAPVQAPVNRNPSLRNRFPSRGQKAVPQPQDQFQAPLVPSRGEDPIVEIPSPDLSTVSPTAVVDETKVRDNFARQKSINDLYALTRLHQLAINTRVPNRKLPETAGVNHRGPPPKQSGGFINSAEVTTHFADDNMLQSESTTISSFVPPSLASSADFQRITTTTEEAPASSSTTEDSEQQRPGLRPKNNRFRGRNRPTAATSTTEAAPRPVQTPNRFAGRRRPSTAAPSPTSGSEAADETVPSVAPQATPARGPTRNRFAGRTRPTTTTTTTEVSEPFQNQNFAQEVDPSVAPVQPTQSLPQPQLPRRRPGAGGPFQGRRRQSTPAPSVVPESAPVETSDVPIAPTSLVVTGGGDERRGNFGKRGRARPNAPTPAAASPSPDVDQPINRRPILGRPLRSRGPTTTTTTTEVSEPIVDPTATAIESQNAPQQYVEPSPSAFPENVRVESGPEGAVIAQKVTVSSSTTTSESVEPPKRGSSGVLGRIRSRARPLVQTTTAAPVVTQPERKPSRLNGILNRRKSGPGGVLTTTHNPISEVPEETPAQETAEASQPKPKEIVVSVSSVVTETEETVDHHGDADEHSSTTQGSILNRLKAQRKPGSLYRKRVES